MYDKGMGSPIVKAWSASIFFSLAGLFSFAFVAPDSEFLLPHVIFYSILTINTFFSVRLFSPIQPKDISQAAIDALLLVLYVATALSIGQSLGFAFFALCIFIAAPLKYSLMLGGVPFKDLLKRKILIDFAGTILCTFVLGASLLGFELESAWALAVIFAVANIHLLFIRPMYRFGA